MFADSAWTQAVWYRLRQVTGCPAPNRFQVRHLPILAGEVLRILAMTRAFKDAEHTAERLLIKKVLRGGEAEGPVLEEAMRLMTEAVAADEAKLAELMPRWEAAEIAELTERRQSVFNSGTYVGYAETGTAQ